LRPFVPFVANPHVLTVAASFWPRKLDVERYPVDAVLFETEPGVQILVHAQQPQGPPLGDFVLVHGLEGSSASGYMRSLAQQALAAGYAVHRFNMRNCGGAPLTPTVYNAGLTSDLLAYIVDLDRRRRTPVFLVGFSLGGNLVLKLAGELGEDADRLIAGVCAVSTPIDLGAACRYIGRPGNRLYEWRFVRSMRARVRETNGLFPGFFPVAELDAIKSLYDFDDRVTGPLSGFRDAEHYYGTQSAVHFLDRVRIPALLIQAQDDPMIPFSIYSAPAIAANPRIRLLTTPHGGHMGFISRFRPRFWLDETVVAWVQNACVVRIS